METKTWEVCIELSPLAGDRSTSQVAMNPQAKHGFQIYTKKFTLNSKGKKTLMITTRQSYRRSVYNILLTSQREINPSPTISNSLFTKSTWWKGGLRILSFWKKEPDWYNSLCTDAQPTASSNALAFCDKPDRFHIRSFTLSSVPMFLYVQNRSTNSEGFRGYRWPQDLRAPV